MTREAEWDDKIISCYSKGMIDPEKYGVSLSLKQCRNFGVDPHGCLDWLIDQGWRRFRLMSYWNECEKEQGVYDFSGLDWQLDRIEQANGIVTLSLGVKQPRWPEYHWPAWTHDLSEKEKTLALVQFLTATIEHVRNRSCIVSYQLENEALLPGFGENIDINRRRLRREFQLVKALDTERPIIMSTSTSWGIPLRRPIPDIVGFSFYRTLYSHERKRYTEAFHSPLIDRLRAGAIRLLHGAPSFVHELRCEPWGPTTIRKMTVEEQDKSMSPSRIARNIRLARRIGVYPIDIWGAEWWYWRSLQGDETIHNTVKLTLQ